MDYYFRELPNHKRAIFLETRPPPTSARRRGQPLLRRTGPVHPPASAHRRGQPRRYLRPPCRAVAGAGPSGRHLPPSPPSCRPPRRRRCEAPEREPRRGQTLSAQPGVVTPAPVSPAVHLDTDFPRISRLSFPNLSSIADEPVTAASPGLLEEWPSATVRARATVSVPPKLRWN